MITARIGAARLALRIGWRCSSSAQEVVEGATPGQLWSSLEYETRSSRGVKRLKLRNLLSACERPSHGEFAVRGLHRFIEKGIPIGQREVGMFVNACCRTNGADALLAALSPEGVTMADFDDGVAALEPEGVGDSELIDDVRGGEADGEDESGEDDDNTDLDAIEDDDNTDLDAIEDDVNTDLDAIEDDDNTDLDAIEDDLVQHDDEISTMGKPGVLDLLEATQPFLVDAVTPSNYRLLMLHYASKGAMKRCEMTQAALQHRYGEQDGAPCEKAAHILLQGYASCGDVHRAITVAEEARSEGTKLRRVSYNALIGALRKEHPGSDLFQKLTDWMQQDGVEPNETTRALMQPL
eukprot:g2493.t1